jgi:secondary thiamine-phosphate synthase enzyme
MRQNFQVQTRGEGFYNITEGVQKKFGRYVLESVPNASGMLFIVSMHTSCGLLINEAYDSSARLDLEKFLKYLAPRDLPFIEHTAEGKDDSPSHMKTALLQQNLALPVEEGKILLGSWQGIYLAEFRDAPKTRNMMLKFLEG